MTLALHGTYSLLIDMLLKLEKNLSYNTIAFERGAIN
jgi:hypothetical protein